VKAFVFIFNAINTSLHTFTWQSLSNNAFDSFGSIFEGLVIAMMFAGYFQKQLK